MSNNLERTNDYERKPTRLTSEAMHTTEGIGRRVAGAQGGVGHDAAKVEKDSLNELLTNKLLSKLPTEDFSRIFPHLEPVSLSSGDVLFKMDEEIHFAYFPETAVISHLYILADGGMTEADMIGPEGMVGLSPVFNTPPPPCLSEVSLAGNALRVRAEVLKQEFALGGAMQQLLLNYAGALIAQLSQRAVCNGNHRVEKRLCSWLLMMDDRAGGYPLALTHERISRHLGTRRAGVTSAATSLRDRNIIDYKRGLIYVQDREMLERAACECYPAVKEIFYSAS
jgi:CRP-like cAMP-binding protein